MNDLQKLISGVNNFIGKVEHRLPSELEKAAETALTYTKAAETFFESGQATDFTKLVPKAEPLREGIVAVLKEAEVAFAAVSTAYKKGTLLTAAAAITALQVPGLPNNHYTLATQSVYSDQASKTA